VTDTAYKIACNIDNIGSDTANAANRRCFQRRLPKKALWNDDNSRRQPCRCRCIGMAKRRNLTDKRQPFRLVSVAIARIIDTRRRYQSIEWIRAWIRFVDRTNSSRSAFNRRFFNCNSCKFSAPTIIRGTHARAHYFLVYNVAPAICNQLHLEWKIFRKGTPTGYSRSTFLFLSFEYSSFRYVAYLLFQC